MRLIVVILLFFSAISQGQKQPNIIFILTDDQGYGDFSCFGNPYLDTPNMDKLKSESLFMSNFHVSAVCAPTRAAILTGRYNYRTGVTSVNQSRVNMHPEEHTIAEYLKDAGYNTGLFGKWHLGYNYPMRANDQGFDEVVTWEEMQYGRFNPIMDVNGESQHFYGHFLTDLIFDKAIDFVERKSTANKPFFAFIPTFLPHTHPDGKQVPDKYVKPFEDEKDLIQHTKEVYGMVSKVDENIGRLMKRVTELGLDENTLIIFTSDNGPASHGPRRGGQKRYNNNYRGVKGEGYEGGIRVPLLMRWIGKYNNEQEVDEFTAHIDLLPTIMDICDVPLKRNKVLDGKSLLPLIENKKVKWERTYYHHFLVPWSKEGNDAFQKTLWKKSVVYDGAYKLVEGKELFDLSNDPYEKVDLAKQKPEKVKQLQKDYLNWLDEVIDQDNLPSYPNHIGNDIQPITNLFYFEKVSNEEGWPVKVEESGNYKITLEDIQHKVLPNHTKAIISVKGKEFYGYTNKKDKDLVIDNVKLPKGEYYLKVIFEGYKKQKEAYDPVRMRYANITKGDYGHRMVRVQKQD
ncbi:arylsulfatase [Tamlana sp. 2201CG12-4]|uniref:arylsulfatase n=1 Tax=Tamlana sp. 2201CG12-4 TaxID=3112582 RepID=UPI002DB96AAE|nr:arylsulfatase [Tamlana sp. 2201CG12-4]MEC3908659.1 arylsulfatase [Tamlana sp. 2201CG12-4]